MSGEAAYRARDGRDSRPLVAHVLYRLDVGGLENILVELVRHTAGERFRHAVICLADYDASFRARLPEDVPVYALHKPPGWGMGTFVRLYRLLRELRPDVVHTSNLAALECQPVAALSGVPARVHAEHGWNVTDLTGSNRKYRWLRRLLSPWVQRHVAVSQHLADYLVDRVGIPQRRVRQIYNGVDTQRFQGREPGGAGHGGVGRRFVIGTVGRICAVKDQATLIRAFARLLERHPERADAIHLVLVGSGPDEAELRRLTEELGVASRVEWAGNCSNVAERLEAFDLFVLPSLAEGIPVTVLEAMACGLPVVASRVGGLPELVEEGETGTLVPAQDPERLCDVLDGYLLDEARCRAEGAAGRRRALQRFSLEAMVAAYENLYGELLPRSAARSATMVEKD